MKITKYEHSCVVIEEQGRHLVIDPGVFSKSFIASDTIDCVVVTHVHPDHFDPEKLGAIKKLNPDAMFCTVKEVADEMPDLNCDVVDDGMSCSHGPFHASFYGGKHAIIHENLPIWQNVGVLINEKFYHPGDSLFAPEDQEVQVLAAPAVAPWMKISEAMDFISAVKANQVFPIHNAILSDVGDSIYNERLETTVKDAGGTFTFLRPGESLEV
jgi:L-ascorbate metabolism protein UlaG (beta-lactamase superfamily)